MSYFVTITFDLAYASMSPLGKNVYSKIASELDDLNYPSYVKGRKRIVDLPSNTYIANFDDDVDHQSEVVAFVVDELKRIFKKYKVNGKYFVSAGKCWAWKVGNF